MKKAGIFVSSITGNTRKVSLAVRETLILSGWSVEEFDTVKTKEICREYDLIILCFWCRRSSMDFATLSLLETIHGKQIAAFGTMGSYSDGDYGSLVRKNVRECIEISNRCIGVFCCRGKIAPEKTEKRRRLPENHLHYLTDEGYKRHLSSRNHPDEKDLADAEDYLKELIRNIERGECRDV